MNSANKKIRIAVSSCLAGHNVRYDGGNRRNSAVQRLCSKFDCVTLCPESAIGMGTPRPPINIIKIDDSFRARGKTNPLFDVTELLINYADQFVASHQDICGFVFKARSPSCGLDSTPWKDLRDAAGGTTSGIFGNRIKQLLPAIPTIDEIQCANMHELDKFIENVIQYASRLKPG